MSGLLAEISVKTEELNIILLIGVAIFGGTIGARVFQRLSIPRILGYVTIGILLGPVLNIISQKTIRDLEPFNMFALGIIGFLIGGELKREIFVKLGRQVVAILVFEGLAAFSLVVCRGAFRDGLPPLLAALLGVDFDVEAPGDYYRIAAVLEGDNADPACTSPLFAPDCAVRAGDYLIALDGKEVRKGMNVYALLVDKVGVPVDLAYNGEPRAEGAKHYTFVPIADEGVLRYRRWVESRRALVDAATNGQVAYMHLPDMMQGGLVEFAKVYYAQHTRKGLVIDDRYNGGGFTGDMILDRLERRLWSLTQPREGGILRNPENVFYGPMVLVVNAYTGSNGEYFATAFQVKKLGPVVGMRTWGGAVGIEPRENLVDGGTVTPPQYAPYSPWTGTWCFEGHGVDPDVVVENRPEDEWAGRDPQLEKAVELVLARMKAYYKEWDELPGPPPYPAR